MGLFLRKQLKGADLNRQRKRCSPVSKVGLGLSCALDRPAVSTVGMTRARLKSREKIARLSTGASLISGHLSAWKNGLLNFTLEHRSICLSATLLVNTLFENTKTSSELWSATC